MFDVGYVGPYKIQVPHHSVVLMCDYNCSVVYSDTMDEIDNVQNTKYESRRVETSTHTHDQLSSTSTDQRSRPCWFTTNCTSTYILRVLL